MFLDHETNSRSRSLAFENKSKLIDSLEIKYCALGAQNRMHFGVNAEKVGKLSYRINKKVKNSL